MRWQGQQESDNVEDRRGMGPARIGGVGIGGIVLVLAVSYFTGVNPLTLLNMLSGMQSVTTDPAGDSVPTGPVNDNLGKFASVVLADTEQTWQQLLPKAGREYENPSARAVHGRRTLGLWYDILRSRPVLLSRRSQSLP